MLSSTGYYESSKHGSKPTRGKGMKSILQYGQAINARNHGKADSLYVFHAGVNAVKDGYNVRAFERVVTSTGVTIIRKCRGVE